MAVGTSIAGGGAGGSGGGAGSSRTNTPKTADYTVTSSDSNTTLTNNGATGAVIFTLPTAVVGYLFRFVVVVGQNLRVKATGTETIYLGSGDATDTGGYVESALPGSVVDVECTAAGVWMGLGSGEWSAV